MGAWKKLPAAASQSLIFSFENNAAKWFRYFSWHYLWDGRQYGLHFHDQCFEPAPEVKEALRRLNLKEPWHFDQRIVRLSRAHILAMNNERLSKEHWTQWDDETFYLKPYLDDIEKEKLEKSRSSGIKPSFFFKNETH